MKMVYLQEYHPVKQNADEYRKILQYGRLKEGSQKNLDIIDLSRTIYFSLKQNFKIQISRGFVYTYISGLLLK